MGWLFFFPAPLRSAASLRSALGAGFALARAREQPRYLQFFFIWHKVENIVAWFGVHYWLLLKRAVSVMVSVMVSIMASIMVSIMASILVSNIVRVCQQVLNPLAGRAVYK